MGLFLMRFWPVLIPLIVYWLWWKNAHAKAKKDGTPAPLFREGPWYWAVLSSLVIAGLCFVVLGLSHGGEKGAYVPPHVEDGRVIPGHTEP